ncbi:sulfate adenylyltransferase [Pedobacter antarcticus 4BY]|uniref:sulfate adenylyltransferase n=2 Tax=Pedobacter antarcticus TaxID=34086 RepID=A0A081PJK0_9SPHI|nr:GTP-binding protein [Pedobacter antarcticus]KEQ30873.1 sulfate adenylyltransferase [Pedobacter antarcticus 4BY]SFF25109.1 sulfate adenylyltransferase subunit 1 [Pedobacter antarcticus]
MDILKFFTAGSVDDGKSTLIGRLLYDTNSILADQLEALQASNRKNDDGTIDLAILTDGLRAEREQGITIDVAYKYFQTEKRKFIIADTPGHIQYTRNMVTGASTAKLAIILIDARKGVVEQTIRHSYLVSLLGVSELAVCINKMDMVDYSETVFREITQAYEALAAKLNLNKVNFIPVSALKGDNIVHRSDHMPWYDGSSLLYFLENVEVTGHLPSVYARMPVQWVIRPQTEDLHDYRGYAGRILSGTFKKGDAVTVMPSGQQSVIDRIEVFDKEPEQALTGMSVTLHLKDQVDISRGDVLVSSARLTQQTKNIAADLCWMDQKQLDHSLTYLLQHNSKITKCKIADIQYKVDINTMKKEGADTFHLNDIGRVELKTADELAFDWYDENPANGAAILIDSRTNLTVAALMFREAV